MRQTGSLMIATRLEKKSLLNVVNAFAGMSIFFFGALCVLATNIMLTCGDRL